MNQEHQENIKNSVTEATVDYAFLTADYSDIAEAAEYKGKKVTLYKPWRNPDGPGKFSVYVKSDAGNVKILHFGSKEMSIKRDSPERRKSFRARHNCDQAKDKNTAKYWSCKFWQANKSVTDILG